MRSLHALKFVLFECITLQLHPDFYPEIYNQHVMQNYSANHTISAPKQLENAAPQLLHRSYHAKINKNLLLILNN